MITINEKLYNKMPEKIKKHFTQKPNPSRDEVVSLFPNTQSSEGSFKASDYKQGDGVTSFTRGDFDGYGDSGSASRFFYTAKASKEERNFGLSGFEENDTYYVSVDLPNEIENDIKTLLKL